MPGRYQAVSQSLGGVGGPQEPRYSVDVPGAIDAFTTGASSLIRAAYERKRQAQLDERAAKQQEFQNKTATDDLALRTRIAADTKENARLTREDNEKKARREFMLAGGIPEHVEQQPTVEAPQIGTAEITPLNAPVVPRAPGSMPPVRAMTPAAPSPIRTAVYGAQNATRDVNIPESFDPEKNLRYILGGQTIAGRAALQDDKQVFDTEQNRLKREATAAGQKLLADARIEVAKINQTGRTAKTAAGKAMTETSKSGLFERTMRGLLEKHNGDQNAVLEQLETDQGQRLLKSMGLDPSAAPGYVVAAFGKYQADKTKSENVDTRQSVKIAADLVKGDTEGKPEEKTARAGATVKNIRNAVTATTPPTAAEIRAKADTVAMNAAFELWKKKNPKGKDESRDAYYDRYVAAHTRKP